MEDNKDFYEVDFPQRTTEWLNARAGKFTGSTFADVGRMLKKGGESKLSSNLYQKLAIERENGAIWTHHNPLEWGTAMEPYARELFTRIVQLKYPDTTVRESNLCISTKREGLAVSPDGFVTFKSGNQFLLEIKCVYPTKFYEIGAKWEPEPEHQAQIDLMFYTLGIYKCYYFVFCPLVEANENCFHIIKYEWKGKEWKEMEGRGERNEKEGKEEQKKK